ncbi:MAG TPA: cbb3-type cytochrome c oxidase N-terminal domain-containing protein, partial [Chitinophagales bacterium]|nr:cbb3-type cytochrome c oxidase N-terminal domain-containing protein [Chitinophagales bacterium]
EPVFWVLIAVAAILLYLIYALGQLLILGTKWRIRDKGNKGMMLLAFITCTLLIHGSNVQAANGSASQSSIVNDPYFPLYVLILIELIIVSYLLYSIQVADRARTVYGRKLGVFSMMWKGVNSAKPVEKEEDILLGDHVYDGIQELDNVMPPWLRFLFIATIIFAVIYIPYYFLGYGPTQKERYDESIAKADAAKEERMKTDVALVDENTVVVNQSPEILSAGKEIFTTYCSACHGNEGEGGIGPNFADDYWIHGGSVKDIFTTVKHGVPEKGMAAWNEILTPPQISEVCNYIISLHGTNPPNPKEPQGELWKGDSAAPDSSAANTDTSEVVVLEK